MSELRCDYGYCTFNRTSYRNSFGEESFAICVKLSHEAVSTKYTERGSSFLYASRNITDFAVAIHAGTIYFYLGRKSPVVMEIYRGLNIDINAHQRRRQSRMSHPCLNRQSKIFLHFIRNARQYASRLSIVSPCRIFNTKRAFLEKMRLRKLEFLFFFEKLTLSAHGTYSRLSWNCIQRINLIQLIFPQLSRTHLETAMRLAAVPRQSCGSIRRKWSVGQLVSAFLSRDL